MEISFKTGGSPSSIVKLLQTRIIFIRDCECTIQVIPDKPTLIFSKIGLDSNNAAAIAKSMLERFGTPVSCFSIMEDGFFTGKVMVVFDSAKPPAKLAGVTQISLDDDIDFIRLTWMSPWQPSIDRSYRIRVDFKRVFEFDNVINTIEFEPPTKKTKSAESRVTDTRENRSNGISTAGIRDQVSSKLGTKNPLVKRKKLAIQRKIILIW